MGLMDKIKGISKSLGNAQTLTKMPGGDTVWTMGVLDEKDGNRKNAVFVETEKGEISDRIYVKCKEIEEPKEQATGTEKYLKGANFEGYKCKVETCEECPDDICEEESCSLDNIHNVCNCNMDEWTKYRINDVDKMNVFESESAFLSSLTHQIDKKKLDALKNK